MNESCSTQCWSACVFCYKKSQFKTYSLLVLWQHPGTFVSVSVHRMRCFWGWNMLHVLPLHCTAALLAPYGRWERRRKVEDLEQHLSKTTSPQMNVTPVLEMFKIFAFTCSYIILTVVFIWQTLGNLYLLLCLLSICLFLWLGNVGK